MGRVKRSVDVHRDGFFGLDPAVVGTALGLFSAVCYTITNIFLRHVVVSHDLGWSIWISAIRTVPVALLTSSITLRRASLGKPSFGPPRLMAKLFLVALFIQLAGNVAFQWCLGTVGLALAVPLCMGTLVFAGALLGRIWLGEGINTRTAVAMLLLIVSIAILSLGAERAGPAIVVDTATADRGVLFVAIGVAAACLSGLAYATSGVVIRRVSTGGLPVTTVLMSISATGTIVLGTLGLLILGPERIRAGGIDRFTDTLLAGTFNAAAFFSLGKSLQLITVNRANLLGASQTAMAAIAGVLIFAERVTVPLVVGVTLTFLGMSLVKAPRRPVEIPARSSNE